MIDIQLLKSLKNFDSISLKKWDTLFREWDMDPYIYIVVSWSLWVYKYTTNTKKELKKLATLSETDIIWESAIDIKASKKESSLIAEEDTELLKIEAGRGIKQLLKEHLEVGLQLLEHIIYLSNKRLISANKQIVASYKMSQVISEIIDLNTDTITELLIKFEEIIGSDYLIYVENNPVLKDYFTLKYDTRNTDASNTENTISEIQNADASIVAEQYNITLSDSVISSALKVGDIHICYIFIGASKSRFHENTQKIFTSICTSLAWVIHRYHILQEERNRNYLSKDEKI